MDTISRDSPPLTLDWTSIETRFGLVHIAYSDPYPYFVSLASADTFRGWVRSEVKGLILRDAAAAPRGLRGVLSCLRDPRRFYDGPVGLVTQTPFQRQVLLATRTIACKETCTYGDLAARIGRPQAARAVGTALGQNPLPLLIPCHRVVAAGSRLGQYSDGGAEMKRRLLAYEGVDVARLR